MGASKALFCTLGEDYTNVCVLKWEWPQARTAAKIWLQSPAHCARYILVTSLCTSADRRQHALRCTSFQKFIFLAFSALKIPLGYKARCRKGLRNKLDPLRFNNVRRNRQATFLNATPSCSCRCCRRAKPMISRSSYAKYA